MARWRMQSIFTQNQPCDKLSKSKHVWSKGANMPLNADFFSPKRVYESGNSPEATHLREEKKEKKIIF